MADIADSMIDEGMLDVWDREEDISDDVVSDGVVEHDFAKFEDFKESLHILRAKIRKKKNKKVGLITKGVRYGQAS